MSLSTITLHDKQFAPYLTASQITAADLLKEIQLPCEIAFIRVASYEGTSSTGTVREIMGLQEDVAGRDLVILEDIVDTGHTMKALLELLHAQSPASVEVATLFLKPECLQHELSLRYVGLSIPNDFIVGYGLDYDGLGRNYPDVYTAV